MDGWKSQLNDGTLVAHMVALAIPEYCYPTTRCFVLVERFADGCAKIDVWAGRSSAELRTSKEGATLKPFTDYSWRSMDEEIFDVVNEQDEVIGRRTRSEVHRLGLLHRAVHVLAFNSRGQVFLQQRSFKKEGEPGLWDSSASGHLSSGEDYDTCAIREAAEEIGLRLGCVPEKLFKIAACPETHQEHIWVYRCQSEGPFNLHPDEIERGDWFTPEQITQWIAERPQELASSLRLIWGKLAKGS